MSLREHETSQDHELCVESDGASPVQRLIEVLQLQPQLVDRCTVTFQGSGGFCISLHHSSWEQVALWLCGLGLPTEPIDISPLDDHRDTIVVVHDLGDQYQGGMRLYWFSNQRAVQVVYGPPEVWPSFRRVS